MEAPKLKRVVRFDNIKVDDTYYTDEGFLIDHPIVTTVGIFEYMNPDGSIRRELRLPDEVFSPESLKSYEGKPIIITHDAGVITKENVEEEIIGTILSEGYRDGDNVRAKIVIHDTDKMKQSGLRELSLGYNLTLDETPGEWRGHPYDAIQRNIEINHLALVAAARAGEQARLNIDGKENLTGGSVMENNSTDGVLSPEELTQAIAEFLKRKNAVEPASIDADDVNAGENPAVTEVDAPVDNNDEPSDEDVVQSVKDRRDRRDADAASNTKESALETIHQQDADIDALLKLIEQLQAKNDFNAANADGDEEDDADEGNADCDDTKQDGDNSKSNSLNLDAAMIDKIVAEKIDVIRTADRLHLDGIESMPITDAKKAVIKATLPKMRLDGKSTDYVNALYDLAKVKAKDDGGVSAQRKQMFNKDSAAKPDEVSNADKARARMIERQTKNGGKE